MIKGKNTLIQHIYCTRESTLQTKTLLQVSTSPSLPLRSGPHLLSQQSSLLFRWVSKTRTREASFLLYCTLKQHPVAPRSLLVPSAVTGHRRPRTLLNLSRWCLLGFLSASSSAATFCTSAVMTEAHWRIQTCDSPQAGCCETSWIPQAKKPKK